MNIISVTGNLAKDCEVKKVGDDKFIAFTVCDNIYQGEGKEDHTNYLDVFWKVRTTEKLVPILTKGAKVTVNGELMVKKNEKDGKIYYNIGIRYPKVDLPSKSSRESDKEEPSSDKTPDLDDEIPF